MRQLRAAVRFGADAVYVGMKNYGLRAYAGNFDDAQLKEAIAIVHGAGKRLYVTMNIFAYDEDIPGMLNAAQRAQALGVDAAIVSDLGVMTLLRKQVPALPLHVSTQANTVNARTASLYHALGAQRVILARELSLSQIRQIRENTPAELELEAFRARGCVHELLRTLRAEQLPDRAGRQSGKLRAAVPLALRTGRADAPRRIHAHLGGRARHLHPQLRMTCA